LLADGARRAASKHFSSESLGTGCGLYLRVLWRVSTKSINDFIAEKLSHPGKEIKKALLFLPGCAFTIFF
jgi:hypothetical protein